MLVRDGEGRSMAEFLRISLPQTSLYAVGSPVRRHDFHELIYALSHGYHAQVEGREVRLVPGQFAIYAAGTRHQPLMPGDAQTRFYVLQWLDTDAALAALPDEGRDADGRLLMLLRWMWEADTESGKDRRLLQRLLELVLTELEAMKDRSATTIPQMAMECMRQDMHHPLCLQDTAALFGISIHHLIRLFRRETGMTPGQYLIQLRLSHALHLLSSSDAPLKEIARRVGFGSAGHLGKLIKR
jgi:AraC-like DNA-binding protein